MQCLRHDTVAHRHHHLDHPSHTCRSLGVADVRLDRAKPQRIVLGAILPIGCKQGLSLDRIAQGGTRPVSLHHVDLGGREAGVGQGLSDHALLGRTVGRRQPIRRAILVDSATAYQSQDLVTIATSVGQALQQKHSHTLRPTDTIGRVGERLRAPIRSETTLKAEANEYRG